MLFWQYTTAIKGWLWKFHCSWKMRNQGLVDNWKKQVKCPRQQQPARPSRRVHNWFLSPCCSSTYRSDSDRESHGIMPQPHKMLKIVTNTRYEPNLVMKMQDSKGHWWYLVVIKQAHASKHLVLAKASRYRFRKRFTENVLKQPVRQGNKRLSF